MASFEVNGACLSNVPFADRPATQACLLAQTCPCSRAPGPAFSVLLRGAKAPSRADVQFAHIKRRLRIVWMDAKHLLVKRQGYIIHSTLLVYDPHIEIGVHISWIDRDRLFEALDRFVTPVFIAV